MAVWVDGYNFVMGRKYKDTLFFLSLSLSLSFSLSLVCLVDVIWTSLRSKTDLDYLEDG
jgi:hypothetical protein